MTATDNLSLPYIAAAQAQKHVTHNEALRMLDALVMLAVIDRDLAEPPAEPPAGARYIVAAEAEGDWTGHDGEVAAWQDGAWSFLAPRLGWLAYVADEETLVAFDGAIWQPVVGAGEGDHQNIALLGVGTEADATNPFAAKLNNALWTALETGEGGDGDLRYKLNKEAAANTLSMLFQTGYEGRAEIGLAGDDDLSFKVSADGEDWLTALSVAHASGAVDLLAPAVEVASAATCDIGAAKSLRVDVTGTTTITSFGGAANRLRFLRFAAALTLTHDAAALILPTGASITTAAGDTAIAISDAAGNWRVHHYQRADGVPLAAPGAAGQVAFHASGAFGTSSVFVWDNTNERLGLAVASPSHVLHARRNQNAETRLFFDNQNANSAARVGFGFLAQSAYITGGATSNAYNGINFFGTGGDKMAYLYSTNSNELAVGTFDANALVLGTNNTQRMRIGAGGEVYLPSVGTTASAANAFLDSGSSPANQLLRSTSRRDTKRDIEPVGNERAAAVLALDPVWYRSALPADNPDWSWYGLIAEDVAAVDPRLVHYGYPDEAYKHRVVDNVMQEPLLDDDGKAVTGADGEALMREVVLGQRVESRLRDGAQKVPMGVAYDRVAIMQIAALKRLVAAQEARIAALEAAR